MEYALSQYHTQWNQHNRHHKANGTPRRRLSASPGPQPDPSCPGSYYFRCLIAPWRLVLCLVGFSSWVCCWVWARGSFVLLCGAYVHICVFMDDFVLICCLFQLLRQRTESAFGRTWYHRYITPLYALSLNHLCSAFHIMLACLLSWPFDQKTPNDEW